MYGDKILEAHRRLDEIMWEIEFVEYQCKINPSAWQSKLNDLKKERRDLNMKLDAFYFDPMTKYCGI